MEIPMYSLGICRIPMIIPIIHQFLHLSGSVLTPSTATAVQELLSVIPALCMIQVRTTAPPT